MPVAVGFELPPLHKKVFQRALVEKSFEENSVHRDDYVQKHGYSGALVSAYVMTGYLSEMMLKFFGPSWLTTGKYELSFIQKGIQLADLVVCRGKIIGVTPLDENSGEQSVEVEFWIDKEDGSRPTVGTATAVFSPA